MTEREINVAAYCALRKTLECLEKRKRSIERELTTIRHEIKDVEAIVKAMETVEDERGKDECA